MFKVHDYMDMYPSDYVRTFKGGTLEDIIKVAKEYVKHMNANYSGGTTSFVKVMTKEEAETWIDKELAIAKRHNEPYEDWLSNVTELLYKCYE